MATLLRAKKHWLVNDEWVLDEEKMALSRLHKRDRHETYLPTTSPILDEFLDSSKTVYEFKNGKRVAKEDQWKSTTGKKQPFTKAAWKGKPFSRHCLMG